MNVNFIKKVSNILFGIYISPLASLSSKSDKSEKAVMRSIIKKISSKSYDYIRYSILPKQINIEPSEKSKDDLYDKMGIVLQGPIRTEDDFTIKTVLMYSKMFPGINIVVSTWNDISDRDFNRLSELGAYVIKNDKPSNYGAGNVNLQLKSSLEGIKYLQSIGCVFSFKTRTDQRMYSNDIIKYSMSLDKAFPVREAYKGIMNNRLIFISYGKSYRYLPFGLCDFLVCGHTENLYDLYNIEYNKWPNDYHILRQKEESSFYSKITEKLEPFDNVSPYDIFDNFNKLYYENMCAESYIVHNFYDKNIHKTDATDNLMKHYYYFLSQFAVVMDSREVELLWPKYDIYNVQLESSLDYLSKLDFKNGLIYIYRI